MIFQTLPALEYSN